MPTTSVSPLQEASQSRPDPLRRWLWRAAAWQRRRLEASEFARIRRVSRSVQPGERVRILDYDVMVNDGPNLYMLYKDLFVRRMYHFSAQQPRPLVLDCGANVGISTLYFKHVYPDARVIAFEPDPQNLPYLHENIVRNKLEDVEVVPAAVAGEAGQLAFYSDGKYCGCIEQYLPDGLGGDMVRCEVASVALCDYLDEPVDFMKMNIEGAEWDVLRSCEDRLRQIREMIVQYHHQPGLPRTLHELLAMLHRQGFEYIINDMDREGNPAAEPPFHLKSGSRYCLFVYAVRRDW